jgi:hypothetical protein
MMSRTTLLSDWGMAWTMIELAPEVNRAFSAGAFSVSQILGRCPRLGMTPRLWPNTIRRAARGSPPRIRPLADSHESSAFGAILQQILVGTCYGAAKPISIGAFGFCVFTITALAGCTFTSLYLICSTGFKQNSYDFFGLCFTTENRKIKNPQISQIPADS